MSVTLRSTAAGVEVASQGEIEPVRVAATGVETGGFGVPQIRATAAGVEVAVGYYYPPRRVVHLVE